MPRKSTLWKSLIPSPRAFLILKTLDPLTLLSAILVILAFPPWNFSFLVWVAWVPWFFALNRAQTLKQSVVQGVWLNFLMSLGVFHWVAGTLAEFGNLPLIVGVFGLLLFCLVGQPQFILFAWLQRLLVHPHVNRAEGKTRPQLLVILSLCAGFMYVGLDWICPKIFMDTMGHALWNAQYIRQAADLGGAALLTFLIFLVNDAIYFALRGSTFKRVAIQKVILALSLCTVFCVYGFYRLHQVQQILAQTSNGVQVAAIQANIGDFEKVAAEKGVGRAAHQILDSYSELTRESMRSERKPQLIVWPETAYPTTFGRPHSHTENELELRMKALIQEIQIPLLFGGYDTSKGKDFNTFFFLTPQEKLTAYHKSILLIFGEYIPGADSIAWLRNSFPQVGNFGRGAGPEVVSIPYLDRQGREQTLKVAPAICYEALFPNFAIESARQGSQAIFNITNDGWFGGWAEPQLHLALSTFRSIETRLPLFRSTNTGISALVLPDGEIPAATAIDSRTVMSTWIPLAAPIPTLMKAWGDWFGPLGLILGALGLFLSRRFFHS